MSDSYAAIVRALLAQGGQWADRFEWDRDPIPLGPFDHDEHECRAFRKDPSGPNLVLWSGSSHRLVLVLKTDGAPPC